jgi:hypothetical protein
MREMVLSAAAAAALTASVALAPASAMTPGTASSIQAVLAGRSLHDPAAYVCHHRIHTSRRLCWWRPGPYKWRWRPRRWRKG